MKNWKNYLAELIGTCVLVAFGCGVAVVLGCGTPAGYVGTALAFGLSIVAMAYSIGEISGCHINPAVSLAMLLTKRMSLKDFFGYIIAQFLGGILGAMIVCLFTHNLASIGANTVSSALYVPYGNTLSLFVALAVEMFLTFVFVLTILFVTSKSKNKAVVGLVIGLTLTLVHLLGIGLTGTSVNPARSFGPALLQAFKGNTVALKEVWIFIIGPMVGAAAAALAHMILNGKKAEKEEKGDKGEKSEKADANNAE